MPIQTSYGGREERANTANEIYSHGCHKFYDMLRSTVYIIDHFFLLSPQQQCSWSMPASTSGLYIQLTVNRVLSADCDGKLSEHPYFVWPVAPLPVGPPHQPGGGGLASLRSAAWLRSNPVYTDAVQ